MLNNGARPEGSHIESGDHCLPGSDRFYDEGHPYHTSWTFIVAAADSDVRTRMVKMQSVYTHDHWPNPCGTGIKTPNPSSRPSPRSVVWTTARGRAILSSTDRSPWGSRLVHMCWPAEESIRRLMGILKDDKFESGDTIDYFDNPPTASV